VVHASWRPLALSVALAATVAGALVAALALPSSRQTSAHAAGGEPGAVEVSEALLTGRSLGVARTRLRLQLEHTPLPAGTPTSAVARWFVRTPGTNGFRLVASKRALELAPGTLAASAIVEPPAANFAWRVCVAARWEVNRRPVSSARPGCPRRDFTLPRAQAPLEYEGRAGGVPRPAEPSPGAIAAAASFLKGRGGRTAFAVMDSHGHIGGLRVHEHFPSASVVKVMMLTAYLQRLAAHHLGLRRRDDRLLYPMIHFSDNEAASAVLSIVGRGALSRVANEAQMSDYARGAGWWAFTQTSAIDQVRLFSMLGQLIPAPFYGYARHLLSTAAPEHSWGLPPVARPRWEIFYKTGSLPSLGLFNEAARLERDGLAIAIAVFTDGDPSTSYGKETIEDLGARLLAHSP
jgi:hypothetical protein